MVRRATLLIVADGAARALGVLMVIAAIAKLVAPSPDERFFLFSALRGAPPLILEWLLVLNHILEGFVGTLLLVFGRHRSKWLPLVGVMILAWGGVFLATSAKECGCFGNVLRLGREEHGWLLVGLAIIWLTAVGGAWTIRSQRRAGAEARAEMG